MRVLELSERLNQIVRMHQRAGDGPLCVTCEVAWPCPTNLVALGQEPTDTSHDDEADAGETVDAYGEPV